LDFERRNFALCARTFRPLPVALARQRPAPPNGRTLRSSESFPAWFLFFLQPNPECSLYPPAAPQRGVPIEHISPLDQSSFLRGEFLQDFFLSSARPSPHPSPPRSTSSAPPEDFSSAPTKRALSSFDPLNPKEDGQIFLDLRNKSSSSSYLRPFPFLRTGFFWWFVRLL